MMAVEISEETRQIIEVPVPISLPKWAMAHNHRQGKGPA